MTSIGFVVSPSAKRTTTGQIPFCHPGFSRSADTPAASAARTGRRARPSSPQPRRPIRRGGGGARTARRPGRSSRALRSFAGERRRAARRSPGAAAVTSRRCPAGIEPEQLHIEHVREPRQRVPVFAVDARERPGTRRGHARADVRVLGDVLRVVDQDEFVPGQRAVGREGPTTSNEAISENLMAAPPVIRLRRPTRPPPVAISFPPPRRRRGAANSRGPPGYSVFFA